MALNFTLTAHLAGVDIGAPINVDAQYQDVDGETKTATFEDLIAWLASIHGQVQATNEAGEPEVDENRRPVMRDRTPNELLRCLANSTGVGHGSALASFLYERTKAAVRKPVLNVSLGEPVVTPAA